jgi:hypothetical protein
MGDAHVQPWHIPPNCHREFCLPLEEREILT